MSRLGLFMLTLTAVTSPVMFTPVAHADNIDNEEVTIVHFDAGFHLGVLGRVKGEVPATFGDDRSLSPSPGLYFRADIPLGRFFLLRPSVQWRSVKAVGAGGPHDLFSVKLGIGVHYEFALSDGEEGGLSLEPYLFLMAGADAVDRELVASVVTDEGTSFGPSWGARLGLITWVSSRIGVAVAWGFERSDFFPNDLRVGRSHVYITQMAFDLGVTFRLG